GASDTSPRVEEARKPEIKPLSPAQRRSKIPINPTPSSSRSGEPQPAVWKDMDSRYARVTMVRERVTRHPREEVIQNSTPNSHRHPRATGIHSPRSRRHGLPLRESDEWCRRG